MLICTLSLGYEPLCSRVQIRPEKVFLSKDLCVKYSEGVVKSTVDSVFKSKGIDIRIRYSCDELEDKIAV